MDQLLFQSATSLAQLIRSKKISSEELVRAHLSRIQAINPKLNAIVQLRPEEAIREARHADGLVAAGQVDGRPFHGVPMTVKDSLEVNGVVTTSGTLGRASHLPKKDAATVSLMRRAGAIVLGKTNVPELCLAFESDNLIYGRTNNPYDVSRTSGGSSGGEAAIIAAGGSPIGLGSDAGGSVRLPGHFCGIAALKPTSGRVPKTGHFMPPGGTLDRLWQVGPMARFVEDLVTALRVLARPDYEDTSYVPMSIRTPERVDLKKLCIAFYTDNGIAPPTPETARTVRKAASVLTDVGTLVEEDRPSGMDKTCDMWCDLIGADGGIGLNALLKSIGTEQMHPLLQDFVEDMRKRTMSTTDFGRLLLRWDMLRTEMLAFIRQHDAIICPVAATPAIPHGLSFKQLPIFSYTMTYNLTGWPGVVVRCGTSPEGLPIGLQIVARPWREDVALALAQYLQSVMGGWQPPDV